MHLKSALGVADHSWNLQCDGSDYGRRGVKAFAGKGAFMLVMLCNIAIAGGIMSRGPSGRLVVELQPDLKHQLYIALSFDGLTFKEWLTKQAERYISEQHQPALFAAESSPATYACAVESSQRTTLLKKEETHGRKKNTGSR